MSKAQKVISAFEAASFWIGNSKRTPSPKKIGSQFGLSAEKVISIISQSK